MFTNAIFYLYAFKLKIESEHVRSDAKQVKKKSDEKKNTLKNLIDEVFEGYDRDILLEILFAPGHEVTKQNAVDRCVESKRKNHQGEDETYFQNAKSTMLETLYNIQNASLNLKLLTYAVVFRDGCLNLDEDEKVSRVFGISPVDVNGEIEKMVDSGYLLTPRKD